MIGFVRQCSIVRCTVPSTPRRNPFLHVCALMKRKLYSGLEVCIVFSCDKTIFSWSNAVSKQYVVLNIIHTSLLLCIITSHPLKLFLLPKCFVIYYQVFSLFLAFSLHALTIMLIKSLQQRAHAVIPQLNNTIVQTCKNPWPLGVKGNAWNNKEEKKFAKPYRANTNS